MTRILFVDDEARILDGIRRGMYCMREEWRMRFANGGHAALQALSEEPAEIVVSDMRMPGMDGAQLLSEVMRLYPSTVRIILSGNERYARWIGLGSSAAIIGRTRSQLPLVAPHIATHYDQIDRRIMETGVPARADIERWLLGLEVNCVGVWDFDLTARTVIGSRHWVELTGLGSPCEALEIPLPAERVHPDDLIRFKAEWGTLLEGTLPALECGARLMSGDEYRYMRLRGAGGSARRGE